MASFPKSYKDISALEWIENEIKESQKGARIWQNILFAIYPITPMIWSFINLSDKKKFFENYYSLFISYLAAFPLENAIKIKQLLETGRLDIHGGLTNIDCSNNYHKGVPL